MLEEMMMMLNAVVISLVATHATTIVLIILVRCGHYGVLAAISNTVDDTAETFAVGATSTCDMESCLQPLQKVVQVSSNLSEMVFVKRTQLCRVLEASSPVDWYSIQRCMQVTMDTGCVPTDEMIQVSNMLGILRFVLTSLCDTRCHVLSKLHSNLWTCAGHTKLWILGRNRLLHPDPYSKTCNDSLLVARCLEKSLTTCDLYNRILADATGYGARQGSRYNLAQTLGLPVGLRAIMECYISTVFRNQYHYHPAGSSWPLLQNNASSLTGALLSNAVTVITLGALAVFLRNIPQSPPV